MPPNNPFVQRCLIVLALATLAVLLFQLVNLLLLVFAAVVFAAILLVGRRGIARLTGLRDSLALLTASVLAFGLLIGVFVLFGAQIAGEMETIRARLPGALATVQGQLDRWGLGEPMRELLERASADASGLLSSAGGYALTAGSGLADLLLILAGGIFIAAQPGLYRRGLLMLVPRGAEALAADALDQSGTALLLWLRGQLLSMLAVAIFTGIGLWLLGVPAALGLALISGLLDVIPFLGPILAAAPAVLLAFTLGPATAFWTVMLYLLVQQIQGNILQPMIQKHAVDIPPAVLLFSVAAAGILFGILGIILAAPLTVVVYTLVRRLYVEAALGRSGS